MKLIYLLSKKIKIFLALALFSILLTLLLVRIFAQSATVGLIVSPPYIAKDVKAGDVFEQLFDITNQTANSGTFVIESREVQIDAEGNFVSQADQTGNYKSTLEKNNWLTITPKTLTLNVGERKSFLVTVRMPNNYPTQGFYSEIAIYNQENFNISDQAGATSKIQSEVAIPLAINLIGAAPARERLEIVSFTTDKPWYEFTPVKFLSKIRNTGNVHTIAKGQIFISQESSFQNNLDTLTLNKSQQYVYNGSSRTFENPWNDASLRFDDDGNFIINWQDLSKIRFGQYFAQLNLVWNGPQGKEFATAVVSFWIIPWKLILAAIVLLIILFIIFRKIFFKKNIADEPTKNQI